MSSTHAEKHVIALAYQAWGHTRPLVQLSARLVKMRSLHVTFFTTNAFFDKVLVELARSFELGEEAYASRVRVISLGESVLLSGEAVDEGFRRACVKLVAGQELQCVKTGKVHAALPPPRA